MSSAEPHASLALPPSSADCLVIPGSPPLPAEAAHPDQGVPALEPPAPVSARFSRSSKLKWWLERWWELPSWMTSLVLHLTVTIVFASLAVKADPDPSVVITIDSTMSDGVEEQSAAMEAGPLFETESVDLNPSVQAGEAGGETFVSLAMQAAVPTLDVQPPLTESASDPEEMLDSGAGSLREPPSIEIANVSTTDLLRPLATRTKVDPPVETPKQLVMPDQPVFDEIVAEFIQYDIGRLKGEAGQRAQRNFAQLGPEALPALVRGLNRSANIRASCPVVVISRKLEEAVQQTDDQMMINFVLQNIGRDVPRRAPHATRLQSLRDKLAKSVGDREFQESLARVAPFRRELGPAWEARVRQLYDANADELANALSDPQITERAAAWTAISMRTRPDFTADDRSHLAGRLLSQWLSHNQLQRKCIHKALTSLATASGVSSRLPKYQPQQGKSIGLLWQSWWQKHGGTSREDASGELLRLAKYAGGDNAQRLLRQTVEKFPDTNNGVLARHMLTPASKLKLAQNFESQLRLQEAIELYEELATSYTDSAEAAASTQRLEALDSFRPSSFAEFDEEPQP